MNTILLSSTNLRHLLSKQTFERESMYDVSVKDCVLKIGDGELQLGVSTGNFEVSIEGASLLRAVKFCELVGEQPITLSMTGHRWINIVSAML